jgi:hypothetical protein
MLMKIFQSSDNLRKVTLHLNLSQPLASLDQLVESLYEAISLLD